MGVRASCPCCSWQDVSKRRAAGLQGSCIWERRVRLSYGAPHAGTGGKDGEPQAELIAGCDPRSDAPSGPQCGPRPQHPGHPATPGPASRRASVHLGSGCVVLETKAAPPRFLSCPLPESLAAKTHRNVCPPPATLAEGPGRGFDLGPGAPCGKLAAARAWEQARASRLAPSPAALGAGDPEHSQRLRDEMPVSPGGGSRQPGANHVPTSGPDAPGGSVRSHEVKECTLLALHHWS